MSPTPADEVAARERLAQLQQRYPLPPPWALKEIFVQHVTVGQLALQMVGLIANDAGDSAFGSAANSDGFPIDRAYFELIERISIFDARRQARALTVRDTNGTALSDRTANRLFPVDAQPTEQRLSLSNGVALQRSWRKACEAALSELVERDRVLRSWHGQCPVSRLDPGPDSLARALQPHYRVVAYEFGVENPAPRHRVAGLFLFPQEASAPLVYGFAAAHDAHVASARAEREALQRLAFLWGEPLPETAPGPAPTPDYHQEYYLYPPHHAHLRAWLDADPPARKRRSAALYDGQPVTFIDLTPEPLRGQLAVAKAMSPRARKVRFGSVRDEVPHPIV
jgi:hypothetical protein